MHYGKDPKELALSYLNYSKAIPKKIGFDFCDLGWKTKYDYYRFEFSPVWSFVFFGYQLAVVFVAPEKDHYWECFLPWVYETDKTASWAERIEQCRKDFPCKWTNNFKGVETKVDYWDLILKNEFLPDKNNK